MLLVVSEAPFAPGGPPHLGVEAQGAQGVPLGQRVKMMHPDGGKVSPNSTLKLTSARNFHLRTWAMLLLFFVFKALRVHFDDVQTFSLK